MSVLSKPYFHDEEAAFAHLESVLWPIAPICPHCGSINAKHYDLRKTRIGLRKCCEKACRKQFTVRVKKAYLDTTFRRGALGQDVREMPCGNVFPNHRFR